MSTIGKDASCVIYFNRDSAAAMKDLAAAVRNQGAKANLVYGFLFKGDENVQAYDAVIVEEGVTNKARIIDGYTRLGREGVEIHEVRSDGTFVIGSAESASTVEEPPTVQENTTEDSAAEEAEVAELAVEVSDGADEEVV